MLRLPRGSRARVVLRGGARDSALLRGELIGGGGDEPQSGLGPFFAGRPEPLDERRGRLAATLAPLRLTKFRWVGGLAAPLYFFFFFFFHSFKKKRERAARG